jgi:hypothetical protein
MINGKNDWDEDEQDDSVDRTNTLTLFETGGITSNVAKEKIRLPDWNQVETMLNQASLSNENGRTTSNHSGQSFDNPMNQAFSGSHYMNLG